jgi:hypothetical protein
MKAIHLTAYGNRNSLAGSHGGFFRSSAPARNTAWRTTAFCAASLKQPAARATNPTSSSSSSSPRRPLWPKPLSTANRSKQNLDPRRPNGKNHSDYPLNCYLNRFAVRAPSRNAHPKEAPWRKR